MSFSIAPFSDYGSSKKRNRNTSNLQEVVRADARGEERLVGVAEGGVGEEGARGLAHVLGKGLGAALQEHLPEADGRRHS